MYEINKHYLLFNSLKFYRILAIPDIPVEIFILRLFE